MFYWCMVFCVMMIVNSAMYFSSNLLALAYNNRGYLKYLQVDFDGASEDYTCSLGQDRTMYLSFHNRGMIHYRLGEILIYLLNCDLFI